MGLSLFRTSGSTENKGQRTASLPCRIVSRVGARVAPQRCPILRTSIVILSPQEVGSFSKLKRVHFQC
jgi:hypothetical protein